MFPRFRWAGWCWQYVAYFFAAAVLAHGRPDEVVTDRTANVIIRGHAFVQNLPRRHYELGIDGPTRSAPHHCRIRRGGLDDLIAARSRGSSTRAIHQRNGALAYLSSDQSNS